ncbi:multicopper oxidase family protein [Roseibium denhamense]|uniref:Multicopper oxidase with three cupredoxin domains (Includes cell division protein FtsP and spore coat protein CotA) n=1 Tax=Roseibium denhamense TaxID=76305 RepID=A0ABY1NCU8_9HYPH|nr:multicopper oxidase family protein [Roseibium denhamense]MTI06531.1 multicopper oxidase family protein [Roseibium denhamense]SMP04649.1 Multicopper oxidase with three cupredoxin domains (includes cell division protein FtsP and spore coat protein CotA) [Roseibium denhamense]
MDRRTFLQSSAFAAGATFFSPRLGLAAQAENVFELTAAPGTARLYGTDGEPSELWLYNGMLPGPEIRVKRGERVRVRFRNELEEPTSVHWHGIRIDNAMDGVAGLTQPPVMPGEMFDYDFVAPDAGTFWYHAHNMSWNQVPRGLAGALIIEDDEDPFAGADITMMLSDWRLNEDGQLITDDFGARHDFSHAGRLGNWLTVNGISLPEIPLQQGRWHRLRLINSSASRILEIAPSRFGADVIGLDGQTFSTPRRIESTLRLSPAQRMDLAIRPETTGTIPLEAMTGQPFTFANFVVGPAAPENQPLKMPPPNDLPEPSLDTARVVPLVMAGGAMEGMRSLMGEGKSEDDLRQMIQEGKFWVFNGKAGTDQTPLFSAKRGETLLIESRNDSAFDHAIHLHGHHFQVLERNGERLPNADWHDTYTTTRGETVKIAFVADNPGKWLIHCHMLGHAASGMREWFEVS